MPEQLDRVLAELRALLLDPGLTRAVAAGRRRGQAPSVVRAELRPVTLKAGTRLQIATFDGARPYTRNLAPGPEATNAVDSLLAEPFGNWHVQTASATVQMRVTKKGDAQVHRTATTSPPPTSPPPTSPPPTSLSVTGPSTTAAATTDTGTADTATTGTGATDTATTDTATTDTGATGGSDWAGTVVGVRGPAGHDREKAHLLDPGDPLFAAVGASAAKRRQVDAFLRSLAVGLPADPPNPLRIVDLGCGNAYLTFAAYRYLAGRGIEAELTGVDVREDQRRRNTELAERLGCADRVRFVAGTIADVAVEPVPDLVLALHACDTATDEALARGVRWRARWILAAPCCHHDLAKQLRAGTAPEPYAPLTRQPILRERFADVLTDALRASLLRLHGYQVDVVEFVDSRHTPRNLLLRAKRTQAAPTAAQRADYDRLVADWRVTPRLRTLLGKPS
nr:SAM-dependent methyltransferase [Micromonospora sp. DSM 115978]